MEEVDSIILISLREIGCDIEEDVKLRNLTPEDIYKSILMLCKIIKADNNDVTEKSNHLPAQMAQRFAAASSLVDCVKSLGFKGDFGYQTILYSNINELRGVLMWLIEHLPKSEDKVDSYQGNDGKVSKIKSLENEIARKLGIEMRKPWLIDFLQKPSRSSTIPNELEIPRNSEEATFFTSIFHQTSNLIPSVLLTNEKELIRNSQQDNPQDISKKLRVSGIKSSQTLSIVTSPSKSSISTHSVEGEKEDVNLINPKSQLEILSEKVENLKESINMQEEIFTQLSSDKNEVITNIKTESQKLDEMKKKNKLKMQIAMLLDDPEESIEKLKKSLEAAKEKRTALNAKFEDHKQPLEQHLESFSNVISVKLQKIQERVETIKNIKRAIAEIHEDMKVKVLMQQNLQSELSKMKKNSKERFAYTSRIADIIKSIKKQNYDINEILKDTRMLQKSINTIEGQLQRQFTVTEELVWTKTAKQDEYSKKAYKLLIALHTEFSELINLIEATGSIQREIRELEDQIDNERQQNIDQKLQQITRDLQMIDGGAGN